MAKKKEEQEKPSFVLYTEHIEQFDSLSDAQAGQLIKAILHYVAEGEAYIEDPVVSAMMMFIRQTLDRDRKKWEETRQKRVEAGKKGGEESARRRKEQEANAAFAEANQAVNVNVNGNGNEYVNENVVVVIIIIIATAMMTTTTTNRSQIPLFAMNEKSIWRLRKGLLLCAYHCHYRRWRALQNL